MGVYWKGQKSLNRLEILAPVGGPESLAPAVRCGADAVYLGAARFSARGSAQNFDREALAQAVAYCHARGVKVYLALNTLLRGEELSRRWSLRNMPAPCRWMP